MRFSRIWNGFRDEHGIILPLVLVLLALGVLLIAPTLGHGATGLTAHSITEDKANELYAADAGVEAGIHTLAHGSMVVPGLSLNDCNVVVTITDTGEFENERPIYHVESTASILAGNSSTTVDALVSGIVLLDLEDYEGITMNKNNITGGEIEGGNWVMETEVKKITGNLSVTEGALVIFKKSVDSAQGSISLTDDSTIVFCNEDGEGSTFTGSSEADCTIICYGNLHITGSGTLAGATIVFGEISGSAQGHSITGTLCCESISDEDPPNIDTEQVTIGDCSSLGYPDYCEDDYGRFEIQSYELS